ncbi:MAG TPA: LamG-like jellyroll fold domain-containing protein [Armatimonadota bacterium]|jgi:hypothetical protein
MMRHRLLVLCLLLGLATLGFTAEAGGAPAGYKAWLQYRAALSKDPTVMRYYTFDDANSDTVRNLAGNGIGALNIHVNDRYFNDNLVPTISREDYPSWTSGRWPGKSALSIGRAKGSLTHSFLYNTPSNAFTVEAWVRTHADPNSQDQAVLFSIGSGFYDGWKITTGPSGTAFGLGRPVGTGPGKGTVTVSANGRLTGHVWHQLVAVYDGDAKAVLLYIDGVLAGRQEFDGIYSQATPPAANESTPELDRGGLLIGSNNSFKSTLRFDVDEVAVYSRAVPADVIAAHYSATRPTASAEEQVSAHRALLAEQATLAQITIGVPSGSGYFPCDKPVPLTIAIPAAAKCSGRYRVVAQLRNSADAQLWHAEPVLNASPLTDAKIVLDVPAQACALYRIDVQLSDPAGKTIKTATFPIAMRKPLLPIAQMPASAPLAHFGASNMHYEDLGLGGNFERMIQPWCPLLPQGGYDWTYTDLYMKTALDNGLVVVYTLASTYGPKGYTPFREMANDSKAWEEWVRLVVNRYKDKVQYWEVLNEPNGGGQLTAEEYVRMLKSAYAIIRELDPTAKVIGICGTDRFPEWTEDVLAAGGGPYLDMISFHNYIGTSPIQSWMKYHKIDRLRASIQKYIGHQVPIWNGECGIHQPVRVQGRAMTDAEMLKAYPGRSGDSHGWAMASVDAIMMTTEHRCACWQVQSILMDLASGTEKYFLLMGSNRYYPYRISTTQGDPSEKGIALAAMASVTTTMQKIRFISLSAGDAAGMMVTDMNGKNTAILFADKPVTLPFAAADGREYHGMDYLGNPLSWRAQQHRLTLTLRDEPIYIFDVPADFAEARLLAVSKFPSQVSPHGTAQGDITVTNPSDKPFTGTVTLTAAGCRVSALKAITLAPGEQTTLPFTLQADGLARGTHVLAGQLLQNGVVASRCEFTFSSEGVAIPVLQTKKSIVLDGNTDDWAGIPEEKADQATQVAMGRPDIGFADKRWWQGPKDLSYSVKTTWRDDGLYLLIDVTDNILTVAPEGKSNYGYLWDCLELFIDGRALQNQITTYSPGVEQLAVIPRLTDTATACPVVSFARAGSMLDVEFVGKRTATGYLLEGRIKPRANSEFKLVPGTHFGMDISMDDADDGQRRVQMPLHGTEKNSFDTSQWGRYELKSGK